MPDTGEKSEAPTPRRRQEARDEGNVARSSDFSAATTLLGAMLLMGLFARQLFEGMRLLVASMLGGQWQISPVVVDDAHNWLGVVTLIGVKILLPIVAGLFVLSIMVNVVQFGVVFTLKPLSPNFNKLSPAKGLKNLFSKRAVMRLIMALAKVFIVVAVAAICIVFDLPKVMTLIQLEAAPLLKAAATVVWAVAIKIALVLMVLAILDLIYQRWQHEQDMKMSKQEVKEEMKRMEGDPLTKQRRARVARQLAMQRVNQAVPGADVVVTNPTHFAIALKYDDSMAAPKVVAKGADLMAMRIRQLAAANAVPIVERPPLARALYRQVEVGQEIPAEFYSAVAEILAYVYQLNQSRKATA